MTDKKYEPWVMFSDIPRGLPELRRHLKDIEEKYEMTSQIEKRIEIVKMFIDEDEKFEEFLAWSLQRVASDGKERPLGKSSLEEAKDYLVMLESQPPSREVIEGIRYRYRHSFGRFAKRWQ